MDKSVTTTTLPWYKSEINWASIIASVYFLQELVRQVGESNFTGSTQDVGVVLGLVAGVFTFVQRTWFTTKVIEQSANRGGV